jgi:hypothetical protein
MRDEPVIPAHLTLYWSAFWDLTGDRPIGQGWIGRIPFLALDAYARRIGIEGEDFLTFKHHVSALDDAFRADWYERNAPDTE